MSKLITPFQAKLSLFDGTAKASDLPKTPFQLLTTDPETYPNYQPYIYDYVPAGTYFYIPISGLNNVPPVVPPFPTDQSSKADLINYTYSPAINGYKDVAVSVDGGPKMFLGPEYLSDLETATDVFLPKSTEPVKLLNIATFLSPLEVGEHKIDLSYVIAGTAAIEIYGLDGPYPVNFSYNVNVVPVPESATILGLLTFGAVGVVARKRLTSVVKTKA
ncbi:hypothetical protein BST81_05360 [Leptolyngbya sp. 'hensonii']|uniref:PEP-CTERM sorting domain-containing protein n=1 Tax=Leptolyngbya sp. 'hensonii' TaxID=1922337 RepID=UPI00094FCAE5|nr:PEP-CTERM sorting domain-containing protein [Leptolyngbya sp. 'hensonii']OLP19455.1 hypothetical protein BST81_05360 [Leptolyngbya sp. 'hensonii']